ncbi:MAG: hypothetical protein COA58_02540 [Bacteroidetes bacterium]|nr:MAG: hypothetical protein COA58_02540 [Bacteroidota bacterium]
MLNRLKLVLLLIIINTSIHKMYAQCSVQRVFINAVLADPNSSTHNFDTDGDGTPSSNDDEFVQICNDSSGDVAISGWTLSDAVSLRYTFSSPDTIRAGECLTVITDWSGAGTMPSYFRDVNSGSAIWNNGGDDIVLCNGSDTCIEIYASPTAGCVTLLVGVDTNDCVLTPTDLGPSYLPVELLYFRAYRSGQVVNLSWSTVVEKNSLAFEIQRSTDRGGFLTIGYRDAAGNSNQITSYNYSDFWIPKAHYRLKQIDFDGNYMFSNVMKVAGFSNENIRVLNGEITLEFHSTSEFISEYVLTSISGTVLRQGEFITSLKLFKSNFGLGIYLIQINQNGSQKTYKWINTN